MANLIGTAGHVDHGKTTLIQALTGIDTDRLPEEKKRGLTIDVGFAYIDLPEVGRASIVDVPGHERFLTNMLVGALGVDVALLCVAADESVMPQTVEHFQILELLPVERMVVALTRADLVDEEMAEFAAEEVKELLEPTRFKGSPIIAVSALKNTGLDELKRELAAALKAGSASAEGPWYLPIDRVFTIKGHGVVVTGTLAQGTVKEGDRAVLMPDGLEVRVRTVQSHDVSTKASEKGRRTALNLGSVKAESVYRGQAVGTASVLFATDVLDARVRWIKQAKHGSRVRVSIGADEAIAKAFLNDDDPGLLQLRFERPVAAAKGQPLIVRRYSPPDLLAGGRVVVPEAEHRRKGVKVATVDESLDESEAILQAVSASKQGVHTEELCRTLGKSPQALGAVFESLKAGGRLHGFAGLWLTPDLYGTATKRLLAALNNLHEQEPSRLLQPREAAVTKAGLAWKGKPLDRIVTQLVSEDRLRVQGTTIALAGFKVRFSDKQQAMLDRVAAALDEAAVSVPSAQEIASKLSVPVQAVEEILRVGVAAGEIVRVEERIHYTAKKFEEIVDKVKEQFAGRQFTASEFREGMGTTRKYAIPLMEHLDAKGVTKRMGDKRVLLD
ncbi:MAG: selenocysteine-specific translation elongation factor [Armatimonadetes bacterium]|nr:selenocysteine-specific translation elongation factor [Armatimonadota bacterium]